jgi:hypothetical protein
MAEQNKPVIGLEGRRIVRELECTDRPRFDARTSQQILTDECAVIAGPGPDDENA